MPLCGRNSPDSIRRTVSSTRVANGLAFEAREAMLEPRLGPAICRRCDRPYLVRATEFGERITRDRQRPSRLARFVLTQERVGASGGRLG
jgi:hypothetical protein